MQGGDLARDVVVAYQLSRPKTGLDLIASRAKGEDGYFCLLLTAGDDLAQLDTGMDYVFVLDISGSMAHHSKLPVSQKTIAAFTKLSAAESAEAPKLESPGSAA